MEIKGIQKIISQTPELEISKTGEQPPSASGISEIADSIQTAHEAEQQNLFTADFKTFEPENRYTSVHLQQGRVQTDSDFNEQDAINTNLEDGVIVQFESGDMRSSYLTGDLWNSADRPPEEQSSTNDSNSSDPDPKP